MKSFIVTALFAGLMGTTGLMAQSTAGGKSETTQKQPAGTTTTVKGEGKKETDGKQNGRFESREAQRNHAETRSNGHAYSGKGQSKKPAATGNHKGNGKGKGNGHDKHDHNHDHDHATHDSQKPKAPENQRQSTGTPQKSK